MADLVRYDLDDSIATITMDDGKVNALSFAMFTELNAAIDRALDDGAAVVLSGRPGVFSAGFDLPVMRARDENTREMVTAGFDLAERLITLPAPVVIACTGHAIAMAVFLLLTADFRVGARGEYQIGANEVAIGILLPHFPIELARQRLTPAHFHRALINAEMFSPDDAVTAGFLDRAVPPDEVPDAARAVARRLAEFDRTVFAATKLRARADSLAAIRRALEADTAAGTITR